MKTKLALAVGAITLAFVVVTLNGCSSPQQNAVERFLFDTTTNYTPVLITNVSFRSVTVTNDFGALVTQPLREVTVVSNTVGEVVMKPSQSAQAWGQFLSGLADTIAPGAGKLTLLGGMGALGVFGYNRQRKLTAAIATADGHEERAATMETATETLAQSLEVFREVLKQTPQGQALDAKMLDMLQRHQMTAGVLAQVTDLVSRTVDNDKAKRLAEQIRATLPLPSSES